MNNTRFDAAQEAIQYYKNEGYDFNFTEKAVEAEFPDNWEIEAIHSFTEIKNPIRNQTVYALRSKTEDKKGIIVQRVGMIMPFKTLFIQQVELANEKKETPQ